MKITVGPEQAQDQTAFPVRGRKKAWLRAAVVRECSGVQYSLFCKLVEICFLLIRINIRFTIKLMVLENVRRKILIQ